jgi:hypothetical protein
MDMLLEALQRRDIYHVRVHVSIGQRITGAVSRCEGKMIFIINAIIVSLLGPLNLKSKLKKFY